MQWSDVLNDKSFGFWIAAQTCLEQVCIYPKGARQEALHESLPQ